MSSPSLQVLGTAATFGCHKQVEVTARNPMRSACLQLPTEAPCLSTVARRFRSVAPT